MPNRVTAKACSNIALVKYWGKRLTSLNTPDVGSLSLTLDKLHTITSVDFNKSLKEDIINLNGVPVASVGYTRIKNFLDLIREKAKMDIYAEVNTENNFPTAAGLASSASGFAALALAGSRAADLTLSDMELSLLARRGSGSAARSVYGGLVEMNAGLNPDGSDSYAVQLYPESYWDLRMIIAVLSDKQKSIGSTEGMNHTKQTAPYYNQWVKSSENDLSEMRNALKKQDFQKVGEITEHSCLKMHGLAMSAAPGIIYWTAETVKIIHLVRSMRRDGIQAYFTIDAGPQVKILCRSQEAAAIEKILRREPEIDTVISCSPGPGAHLLE